MKLGERQGPLRGVRVVEIAGIGPGPHACMLLADLGADVIRVERPGGQALGTGPHMITNRGRPSVALDLKHPDATETVLELIERADVLVEGMRPGAMERLGLGPDRCFARNPGLVYGRMTGWGQDGPLHQAAGHDMNYIAITGALHGLGQDQTKPHFPSNLLGDFGGGSTYLVIGVLAALLEARSSGSGQVVDAAIVDGTASLNAMTTAFLAAGDLVEQRRSNLLDGGAPFYDIYETSDGLHMSVAALEPQFFAELMRLLKMDGDFDQADSTQYARMRAALTATFAARTQAEWVDLFEGTDACVAGILPISQAVDHPHMSHRGVLVDHLGLLQPAPAPRFSRTPGALTSPPPKPGQDTMQALKAWGIHDPQQLINSGAAVQT